MNPLLWSDKHRIAFIAIVAAGAIAGLFLGFIISVVQLNMIAASGTWMTMWLGNPSEWWPWPIFGGLIASLIFYTYRLLSLKS